MYKVEKSFNVLNGVVPKFSKNKLFSEYIVEQKESDQAIEEFQHEKTDQTPELIDYRYTGANPNNYVCFGSEADPCPEENLYRIIGVIPTQSKNNGEYENRVKLMKATAYEENESGLLASDNLYPCTTTGKGYPVNNVDNNKWETVVLNQKVLNGVYWKNLKDYQNYIENSVWYMGAFDYHTMRDITPKQSYDTERGTTQGYSKGAITYIANIGLIYPSDYGYSRGKSSTLINDYQDSWLYLNKCYWLISPDWNYINATPPQWSHQANLRIQSANIIGASQVRDIYEVHPSFYLKSTVLYKNGTGTKENPYRLKLN